MNQELKEQVHKEFDELNIPGLYLSQQQKIKFFIDSLIDKTVQIERDRIVEWAKSKKNKLTMKWDMDKAKSTVYDSIIYKWNDYPLITNKSDINK